MKGIKGRVLCTVEVLVFIMGLLGCVFVSVASGGNNVLRNVGFMALAAIVVMIVTFAVVWRLAESIVQPLRQCGERMEALNKGDLHSSIPEYSGSDEFSQLFETTSGAIATLNSIISDIKRGMKELGAGNMNVRPNIEYFGDFTELRDSIMAVIISFNDALTKISQSSDLVAIGSDRVAAGSQTLSQGATEQASSVEELAATIDLISTHVGQNAENAKAASLKVVEVGGRLDESNQRMQDMLKAMTDISASSEEIGKIIKDIEDIAYQTNILALNAAVEAARAGAAGKGFAVVADEVRNLASKSSEASQNTAVLIENSLKAVENGRRIADETAAMLADVVTGAKEVVATIDKISNASDEQATSITQVTEGINQISSVVQTNSATAQESAAAGQELADQSQMLKSMVGRFQLLGATDAHEQSAPVPVKQKISSGSRAKRGYRAPRYDMSSPKALSGIDKY